MPMDYKQYPPGWREISLSIRERDNWRCKWCDAENGKPNPATGSTVVLTVAHLGVEYPDGSRGDKTDKMDVRPENLAALCQKCHLNFDRDEHIANAAKTRYQKKLEAGQLELFATPYTFEQDETI